MLCYQLTSFSIFKTSCLYLSVRDAPELIGVGLDQGRLDEVEVFERFNTKNSVSMSVLMDVRSAVIVGAICL